MVHAGEWPGPGGGQALRDANADEQAAGKARPASDSDEVDVRGCGAGALEGKVQQLWQTLEVVAGGKLWDHATVFGVEIDL
jgi:hypothetical protein